jgi:glycosyltransferase involved in cell wall biosynthesis
MPDEIVVRNFPNQFIEENYFFEPQRLLLNDTQNKMPEILLISSYPPRQCGLATYTHDLVTALGKTFNNSFRIRICALESEAEKHSYTTTVQHSLNTDDPDSFNSLQNIINRNAAIQLVVLQHEFGLFSETDECLSAFLKALNKPVLIVFHTVLPRPNSLLRSRMKNLTELANVVIVMTNTSQRILVEDYGVAARKIAVIPHGTHLVTHADKKLLKSTYKLSDRKILSTFGLLSSGKSIETTLEAMPAIIAAYPDVLFLIIGKTHPSVVKQEGEKYRAMLEDKIASLGLDLHVYFINEYLPLSELLDYLQLTDIYLFTSKDPNQAVSGTFSYAISCGCPVISTPIPHAREVLKKDGGIIFDFQNSIQLAAAVVELLGDEKRRESISSNGLHTMASTAWENASVAHALLFEKQSNSKIVLQYTVPPINLEHIKKLTTTFGMIQFSIINQPDIASGYTLDDNARALIALCQHYELTRDAGDLKYIKIYFRFIAHCLQTEECFLNYVNEDHFFTPQNNGENLADANGRAIWALGYLLSLEKILPLQLISEAESIMLITAPYIKSMHSTRAMAFVIKGLYYRNKPVKQEQDILLIEELANRLVQMYRHEADSEWLWFENYLTYANSLLPEAMLCAWLATGNETYRDIAKSSFDFLLSKIFEGKNIRVISNRSWLHHGKELDRVMIGGEQPIDVAYTIIALSKFYDVFKEERYKQQMVFAFNWFLGSNHLHQIIYNPCTGGCYDGLEENYVNLNQGAESTVSYLMARLTMEKYFATTAQKKSTRVIAAQPNTPMATAYVNDAIF